MSVRVILYSKPGCHLCEGLQEKLEQIQTLDFELEVRDITTRTDWFQTYQYEIPVLFLQHEVRETGQADSPQNISYGDASQTELTTQNSASPHPSSFIPLPRPSPRASVHQLEQMLQKYLQTDRTQ